VASSRSRVAQVPPHDANCDATHDATYTDLFRSILPRDVSNIAEYASIADKIDFANSTEIPAGNFR